MRCVLGTLSGRLGRPLGLGKCRAPFFLVLAHFRQAVKQGAEEEAEKCGDGGETLRFSEIIW